MGQVLNRRGESENWPALIVGLEQRKNIRPTRGQK